MVQYVQINIQLIAVSLIQNLHFKIHNLSIQVITLHDILIELCLPLATAVYGLAMTVNTISLENDSSNTNVTCVLVLCFQ